MNDPAPQPDEQVGNGHPVSIPARWGLSPPDWHTHAIDENANHPNGAYIARCGQQLITDTNLHDQPPSWICLPCLRWTDPRTPPKGTTRPTYP